MSNVAPLHSGINVQTAQPNQDVVDALRNLLELAEDGRLRCFIGTGFTCDGLRISTWCDFHDDVYQMLGSLEWVKSEYIHRHTNE